MAYYVERSERKYKRIIVISDIHGYSFVFDELLIKVKLTADDLLIIAGDIINKGHNSIATLRRVMALDALDNVIVLRGNHEDFMQWCLDSRTCDARFLDFLKRCPYDTLVSEMADSIGFDLATCQSSTALIEAVERHYGKEIDYIASLPLYVETERHIIVHSAYESWYDVNGDVDKFTRYDNFNAQTGYHDKTVIVGHWPASNIRSDRHTNIPYINRDKNVISIDGGLGVKVSGELNALIVDCTHDMAAWQHYSWLQANPFNEYQIIRTAPVLTEPHCFVNYPHFELALIARGPLYSRVRHLHSGRELSIYNCLLTDDSGKLMPKVIYNNRFFDLKLGDNVLLVASFSDCHLVKYGDEFGWIQSDQLKTN